MTAEPMTIRLARPADAPALEALAALDSRRPLTGDVLVAEADGRPVAAVAVADAHAVADPFLPTAAAVGVLRVRAAQLRAAPQADRPSLRRSGLRTAGG